MTLNVHPKPGAFNVVANKCLHARDIGQMWALDCQAKKALTQHGKRQYLSDVTPCCHHNKELIYCML